MHSRDFPPCWQIVQWELISNLLVVKFRRKSRNRVTTMPPSMPGNTGILSLLSPLTGEAKEEDNKNQKQKHLPSTTLPHTHHPRALPPDIPHLDRHSSTPSSIFHLKTFLVWATHLFPSSLLPSWSRPSAPSSALDQIQCAGETMASDRPNVVRSLEMSSIPSDSAPEQHRSNSPIYDMSPNDDENNKLEAGQPPTQDHCDDRVMQTDPSPSVVSTKRFAGQTVAPFLARHIPEQYAPMGIAPQLSTSRKDPNTKYCYRHRPDSKCRRTADEPTMENLQWVCGLLVVSFLLDPALTVNRNLRPCRKLTSKAYPTSGPSSPLLLQSTEI